MALFLDVNLLLSFMCGARLSKGWKPITVVNKHIWILEMTCRFSKFSSLPTEVRLKIWNTVCNYERVVCVQEPSYITSRTNTPAVLHTCRESRTEGLKVYQISFQSAWNTVYFNPTREILYIKPYHVHLVMLVLQKSMTPIHHIMLKIYGSSTSFIADLLVSLEQVQTISLTQNHIEEISREGYDDFEEDSTSNCPDLQKSLERMVSGGSGNLGGSGYERPSRVIYRVVQLA